MKLYLKIIILTVSLFGLLGIAIVVFSNHQLEKTIVELQEKEKLRLETLNTPENAIYEELGKIDKKLKAINKYYPTSKNHLFSYAIDGAKEGLIVGLILCLITFLYKKYSSKNIYKKLFITTSILFILSLYPYLRHTLFFIQDARSLILLVTTPSEETSFNPYHKNGILINPEFAFWILKNFEYPYKRCSWTYLCDLSLISLVGRNLDIHNQDTQVRSYDLLNYLIHRKEPLNELSQGLSPIHEAILSENTKYLEILLLAGANPKIKTSRKGKEDDNLNAYEFLAYWEKKRKSKFLDVRNLLERTKE